MLVCKSDMYVCVCLCMFVPGRVKRQAYIHVNVKFRAWPREKKGQSRGIRVRGSPGGGRAGIRHLARVKEGLTPRPPRAARYAKGPRSFARLRALYVFLSFSVPHQAFSVSESAREDGTAASFLITEPRDRRASAGQHRRRTDTVDVHISAVAPSGLRSP